MVSGDLNWDLRRKTKFSKFLQNFVDKVGLTSVWTDHSVDFMHMHTNNKSTSVLDHFLLSPRLRSLVHYCQPIHRGDNMSRHSPILLQLNLGSLPQRKKKVVKVPKKPAWSKASVENIDK